MSFDKDKLKSDMIQALSDEENYTVLEVRNTSLLFLMDIRQDTDHYIHHGTKLIRSGEARAYAFRVLGNHHLLLDDVAKIFREVMGDSIVYRLSTYGLLLSAGGWTLTINQNEIEIDSLPPVTSIVATAANYVEKKGYPIGRNNDIPWRCLDDLGNFKAVTEHNAIVMGSGTFESLVFKPLKNRLHLVLTRKPSAMLEKYKHLDLTNVVFVLDQRRRDKEPGWPIKRAIRNAHELLGYRKVLVIGGGQIYRYLEPLTTSMHWTKVNCVVEDADTFYSPSDEFIPRGVAYLEQEQDDRNDHSFKVYRYFKPKQMD